MSYIPFRLSDRLYCQAEVRGIEIYVEMSLSESYDPDSEHDVFVEVGHQIFFFSRKVKVSEMDALRQEE